MRPFENDYRGRPPQEYDNRFRQGDRDRPPYDRYEQEYRGGRGGYYDDRPPFRGGQNDRFNNRGGPEDRFGRGGDNFDGDVSINDA